MPDFQLSYSGEQVNTAIGNGLNAVTTESGQTLTPEQQQVVQKKIGLEQLFSHTAPPIVEDKSGSMVSITDASNQTAVSLASQIVPVQAGSGEPSPYNVRPISGWSSVEATRTGGNILSRKNIRELPYTINGVTFSDGGDGKIVISGTATASATLTLVNRGAGSRDFIKAGTYTASGSANQTNATVYYQFYADQKVAMGESFLTVQTSSGSPRNTFTLDRDCYYGCYISVSTGRTPAGYTIPQIEAGTAATAYEPYEAETLTADLPETVYGGERSLTTGVLTVDRFTRIMDGTERLIQQDIQLAGASGFYMKLADNGMPLPQYTDVKCSHFVSQPAGQQGSTMNAVSMNNAKINMVFNVDSAVCGSTVDEFKAYLSAQKANGTPVTVSYVIAEPYDIQLAPQQLTMLKGNNNVWSNSGDTTISYVADTKMYIDGLVSSIASSVLNN